MIYSKAYGMPKCARLGETIRSKAFVVSVMLTLFL
jgi:hypothetical protein